MLHDVKLPEPRLIERITGGVYDVTEAVLLGQHEHRVKETFHRARRLNKCRPKIRPHILAFIKWVYTRKRVQTIYELRRKR